MGLQTEITRLISTFYNNGYPKTFCERIVEEFLANKTEISENEEKPSALLKIPYCGKPSLLFAKRMRRLIKIIANVELKTVYTSTTVGSHFMLKDATPHSITPRVVYRFTCLKDSDTNYVGYTNRLLAERVHDHVR